MQVAISKLGGTIHGTVRKDTNFVIWDGLIESSKYQKAIKLGIPILSQGQIVELLEDNLPKTEEAVATNGETSK